MFSATRITNGLIALFALLISAMFFLMGGEGFCVASQMSKGVGPEQPLEHALTVVSYVAMKRHGAVIWKEVPNPGI